MSKSFSIYLDLMRFLAAVFVVLSHFVQMNVIQGQYAFFTPELGRDAVILFFVLSGYVIAYTTDYKKPSLVEYSIARMTRIYSVALPLLFLSGIAFFSLFSLELYDGSSYVYQKMYLYYPLYTAFIGDLWLISETPPLLTPYWSLAYEVWYYIFFASIYFFRGYLRFFLASVIFIFIGYKLWLLLPIWILGVVLYHYDNKVLVNYRMARAFFVLSFMLFILFKLYDADVYLIAYGKQLWPFDNLPLGSAYGYLSDYIICLLVLMNFYFAKHAKLGFLTCFEKPIRFFSYYTFTLYLTHWLVLKVFSLTIKPYFLGYEFFSVSILVIVFTYVIGELTEKRRFLFKFLFESMYKNTLGRWKLDVKNPSKINNP